MSDYTPYAEPLLTWTDIALVTLGSSAVLLLYAIRQWITERLL